MNNRWWALVLCTAVTGNASCQSPTPKPRLQSTRAHVPISPPDTVPSAIYDSTNLVVDRVWMTGTYLRDILVVLFKPGAPQRERQAAVDLVRGQVIGGQRLSNGDGLYYIRVSTDGKPGSLRPAMEALQRLPQVQAVRPEFMDMGLGPM